MQQNNGAAATIDPVRTALLLLHWQNDMVTPSGKIAGNMPERLSTAHTIEHTQAILKASREKGMLIVYVCVGHRPGYPELPAKFTQMMSRVIEAGALVRGTWGSEVIDQLKPLDDEILIYNYSPSGFIYTELDLILRNKGITNLVLTGFATNWVVESTARDGTNRGYFIYVLKDCCSSHSDEMHDWSLNNILSNIGVILDSEAYLAALQGR